MSILTIINIAAIAASSVAVLISLKMLRTERKLHRGNQVSEMALPSSDQSREHMRQLLLAMQRLERQVDHISKRVVRMERKSEQPTAVQLPSLPLDKAVRLAQSGASIAELSKRCGLNNGEAMLMRKLHAGSEASH